MIKPQPLLININNPAILFGQILNTGGITNSAKQYQFPIKVF
jgi:hypothetical protein